MRGTLRGVRARVDRLSEDVQRRSEGPDWERYFALVQEVRQRARERAKNPAKRPTHEENLAKARELGARLQEARYL